MSPLYTQHTAQIGKDATSQVNYSLTLNLF
jgi:hypothetical protein